MRYMLMMNTPSGNGDYSINSWSPEDIQNHMNFMHGLNKDLVAAGEFVTGQGLTPPKEAKLVKAGRAQTVTDGPFPETKEFLAGFWIVEVDSPERAYAIAERVSTAPGPNNVPLNIPVEVRRVMEIKELDV